MSNGEAVIRRYEVRDAETGEVVEGPLYVLRPREDALARTVMFCYAHLLNLDVDMTLAVGSPSVGRGLFSQDEAESSLWRQALSERMDIPEDTVSQDAEQFRSTATIGLGGDGSMKRGIALMESMGYELACAAFRMVDKTKQEAARHIVRALQDEELRRERTAAQVAAKIEGPMV